MIFILIFLVVLLVAVALLLAIANKPASTKSKDYKTKPLLTNNEKEFFDRLVIALPRHYIFPQVSFGALLQPNNPKNHKEKMRIRGTFSQKIADFVVADPDLNILAIVELDDRTHNPDKDSKRDQMLGEAGYKIIRWQSKAKPTIEQINEAILGKTLIISEETPQ